MMAGKRIKRLQRLLLLILTNSTLYGGVEGSFAHHRGVSDASCRQFKRRRRQQSPLADRNVLSSRSAAASEPPSTENSYRKVASESNFWYTVLQKDQDAADTTLLPAVPSLDRDGPLPPGAYLTHGDPQYDPKATCRLSIAVNLRPRTLDDEELEPPDMVRNMQKLIDTGLTSFQLKESQLMQQRWAEENIYGRLRQDTPASVMDRCHLVVPLETTTTPSKDDAVVNRAAIRKTVLGSLHRIGGDAIDTVQLKHRKESPYHMDILDYLQDLKREGLIRSVSACNMPAQLVRSAIDGCGLAIDSNQLNVNLLDPTAFSLQQQLVCSELGVPLFVSSPLAGGLLTDRHVGQQEQPYYSLLKLCHAERSRLETSLKTWGKQHWSGQSPEKNNHLLWEMYQTVLLETVQDIARKHRVSIASVALRWALQFDPVVASAVVSCRLLQQSKDGDDGMLHKKPREQELRQVFSFELDKDDMERLWEVSGQEKVERIRPDLEDEELLAEMMESESGLFLRSGGLDLSNRKLWL